MIGKIIGALLVIGLIFFGAIWLLTGESPLDLAKDLSGGSSDGITSDNARDILYEYNIHLGEPYNEDHIFDVKLHVLKRTTDSLCYNYQIIKIVKGGRDFAEGFMNSYEGVSENEPVCVDMNTENPNPKYHFTDSGTTMSNMHSENGVSTKYKYVDGILRSLKMNYKVYLNNTSVPVDLSVKYLGAENTESKTSATTSGNNGMGGAHETSSVRRLSSKNVKTLLYRFTWNITQIDIVTNKTNGTLRLDYNVLVEIVNRSNSGVCLKYKIEDIFEGDYDTIRADMYQVFAGYDEGEVRCVGLYGESPEQIPYYLLNPQLNGSRIFNGEGINGVVNIENGVVTSLELTLINQLIDDQGNIIATLPINISATLTNYTTG